MIYFTVSDQSLENDHNNIRTSDYQNIDKRQTNNSKNLYILDNDAIFSLAYF